MWIRSLNSCESGAAERRTSGSRVDWRSLSIEHRNTVAPRVDDVLDALVHLCSSRLAVDTRHEQCVVVGVDMAGGGGGGGGDNGAGPGPARGPSSPPGASSCPGMEGKSPRPGGRA